MQGRKCRKKKQETGRKEEIKDKRRVNKGAEEGLEGREERRKQK